jgi:hypothetical protein
MNKEEYTKIKFDIPTLSDLEIQIGLNNVLSSSDLIKKMNELIIKDKQERYIRELTNRIYKALEYIEKQIPIVKNEINISNINTTTSELLNYEKLLEILKGKDEE